MAKIETTLMFDMRAPAFGTPARELYAALDMAKFGDEIGIDRINLMEHHGSEDGYLPTPFVLGGGVAARTKHCRIQLGAVILPLHDPVKVAEQIGVLDLMSGGRLEVTLGAGYVASEFAMFNASLRDRAKLMDEGIEIILRALRGERFTMGGREIFVRPLPLQKPESIIYGGGGVPASAKRAAKFGIGFVPINPSTIPIYEEECRKLGHEPGKRLGGGGGPLGILICEDPDEGWRQFQPHALHMVREYAKWAAQEPNSNSPFVGLDNEEALRKSGLFVAWTPDEVVKFAGQSGSLSIMPLLAGLKPEIGWKTLELLRDKVMPRLGHAS